MAEANGRDIAASQLRQCQLRDEGRAGVRRGLTDLLLLEDERYLPNVYAPDDVSFADGAYSVPFGLGLGLQ